MSAIGNPLPGAAFPRRSLTLLLVLATLLAPFYPFCATGPLSRLVLSAEARRAKAKDASETESKAFLPPSATMNGYLNQDDVEWIEPQGATAANMGPVTLTNINSSLNQGTVPSAIRGVRLASPQQRLQAAAATGIVETTPEKAASQQTEKVLEAAAQVSESQAQQKEPAITSPIQAKATLVAINQRYQEEELKALWRSTVERNPVIRFSLEKLALPTELHPSHSSQFLNKTLSVLVSGAAIGASMFSTGGAYTQMGILAGGQALQNLMTGNTGTNVEGKLSPTEQIQLAGLVDSLKQRLMEDYQAYVLDMNQLATVHQQALAYNEAYSRALGKGQPLEAFSAGAAYYQAMMEETRLRQHAQHTRLNLERLAGADAVKLLTLRFDNEALATLASQPQLASVQTASPLLPTSRKAAVSETVASITPSPKASDKIDDSQPAQGNVTTLASKDRQTAETTSAKRFFEPSSVASAAPKTNETLKATAPLLPDATRPDSDGMVMVTAAKPATTRTVNRGAAKHSAKMTAAASIQNRDALSRPVQDAFSYSLVSPLNVPEQHSAVREGEKRLSASGATKAATSDKKAVAAKPLFTNESFSLRRYDDEL